MRAAAALAALGMLLAGCGREPAPAEQNSVALNLGSDEGPAAADLEEAAQTACTAKAGHEMVRRAAFDEAIRQLDQGADPGPLQRLANGTTVRLEQPRVTDTDYANDRILCAGRIVLELPRGTAMLFDGAQELPADVAYAVQLPSGRGTPSYTLLQPVGLGARLVAGDQRRRDVTAKRAREADERQAQALEDRFGLDGTSGSMPPLPATADCTATRTYAERMICQDSGLADQDRRVIRALRRELAANIDPIDRADLMSQQRDFLAERDRCPSIACLDQIYRERLADFGER